MNSPSSLSSKQYRQHRRRVLRILGLLISVMAIMVISVTSVFAQGGRPAVAIGHGLGNWVRRSAGGEVFLKVKQGTPMMVYERVRACYRIVLADGTEGWMAYRTIGFTGPNGVIIPAASEASVVGVAPPIVTPVVAPVVAVAPHPVIVKRVVRTHPKRVTVRTVRIARPRRVVVANRSRRVSVLRSLHAH